MTATVHHAASSIDNSGGTSEILLLGPLELRGRFEGVLLPSGRLRSLLAVLAVSVGRSVSVETIAERIWGEQLPRSPRRTVQTLVTRLRYLLGPETIRTSAGSYRLDVEPDRVDVVLFGDLVRRAAVAESSRQEHVHLVEALSLWRGTPFESSPSDWLRDAVAPALVDRYLTAWERRADLDLAAGRHHDVVADLWELAGAHPFREPLWLRLLSALDRCGRRAEALHLYARFRDRLAADLGVDPAPALRHLHRTLVSDRTHHHGLDLNFGSGHSVTDEVERNGGVHACSAGEGLRRARGPRTDGTARPGARAG